MVTLDIMLINFQFIQSPSVYNPTSTVLALEIYACVVIGICLAVVMSFIFYPRHASTEALIRVRLSIQNVMQANTMLCAMFASHSDHMPEVTSGKLLRTLTKKNSQTRFVKQINNGQHFFTASILRADVNETILEELENHDAFLVALEMASYEPFRFFTLFGFESRWICFQVNNHLSELTHLLDLLQRIVWLVEFSSIVESSIVNSPIINVFATHLTPAMATLNDIMWNTLDTCIDQILVEPKKSLANFESLGQALRLNLSSLLVIFNNTNIHVWRDTKVSSQCSSDDTLEKNNTNFTNIPNTKDTESVNALLFTYVRFTERILEYLSDYSYRSTLNSPPQRTGKF